MSVPEILTFLRWEKNPWVPCLFGYTPASADGCSASWLVWDRLGGCPPSFQWPVGKAFQTGSSYTHFGVLSFISTGRHRWARVLSLLSGGWWFSGGRSSQCCAEAAAPGAWAWPGLQETPWCLVCYPALYNDLILKGLSTLQDPSPSPAPLPPQNNMQEREKTTTTNNKKPTPESFSSIFQTLTASPPPQFPVCLSQKRFLTAGYPHIRVYDSCGSCPVCGGCPEWACAVWSPVYVWRELCAQRRRVKDAQKSDGPVVVNPFWSFSL